MKTGLLLNFSILKRANASPAQTHSAPEGQRESLITESRQI